MGPVSAKITIDAPRERVFEVISDLANRPAFCDHFAHEFHLQRLDSTGVGAAARFQAEANRFHDLDGDRDHRARGAAPADRARPGLPPGPDGDRDRLGAGRGPGRGTTEVTVTFWAEPTNHVDTIKGKLGAARWYRRQWRKALHRLRDLIESDEPIERLQVAGAARV